MAAEVGGEAALAARVDVHAAVVEDGHVGALEAVDRLLGIADGAEMLGIIAREVGDHLDLLLVGVLELVDHHELELAAVQLGDLGILGEGAMGFEQKVAVVDHAESCLAG